MKTPIKLDIEPGSEWLLPAARRWLAQAKRVMRTPHGSKVFDLPGGEKVTVNWRGDVDYIRTAGAGIPYHTIMGLVQTPYAIDCVTAAAQYDAIFRMDIVSQTSSSAEGGICLFGSSTQSYVWQLVDIDTGEVHTPGSGEMYRCFTSCGGGGCAFTGYAVDVPFTEAGGGTTSPPTNMGSTSGCSNVTCFNQEHYYYRGNEALYNNGKTRVTTVLSGVVTEVPYLSLIPTGTWDGTETITGRAAALLYNFTPPWTSNILSAYLDMLNGSDLGPSSMSFSMPPRVVYTASSVTDDGTRLFNQRKRAVAMEDWAALRAELLAGAPDTEFVRSVATGVASLQAVRSAPITVDVVNTTPSTGVTQRDVAYSYTATKVVDGEEVVDHVADAFIGTSVESFVPVTKRNANNPTLVTDTDFLIGTRLHNREYRKLPVTAEVTADQNGSIGPQAPFLKKYWGDVKLRDKTPADPAPGVYDATANTPNVTGAILLYSPVYSDDELNNAIGITLDRATAAHNAAVQEYETLFRTPANGRVGIGPLSVANWRAITAIPIPTEIAIHGVMHVRYNTELCEFVFSRWEDLGGFKVEVPSDVTTNFKLSSGMSAYSGYQWTDIVNTATLQKKNPSAAIAFLNGAIKTARAAIADINNGQ